MTNDMIHIPKGSNPEDIKARKKLIGDFYARWCAEHPDKQIWNRSLNAFIHVKYHSINETKGQASITYESTRAVFQLTKILGNAIVKQVKDIKANNRNQRPYDKMILLCFREIQLFVGHQKVTDEYVQYCIAVKK